jgi:hypothetical protein
MIFARKMLSFAALSLYHTNRLLKSYSFMTAGPTAESLNLVLPDFDATFAQGGLAFIAHTRRQLARFDCLPGRADSPIDAAEAAAISRLCGDLEVCILSHCHRPD